MISFNDFKDLRRPWKIAVTLATIVGLAGAGYGAYTTKNGKSLDEHVSIEETYNPNKNENGKLTYTFKTNDNQRNGYTVAFKTETAFKQFNVFIANYFMDHEKELESRDYLTAAEAWQLMKIIDDRKSITDRYEITDIEMDNAFSTYQMNKSAFKIAFDTVAPCKPRKAFDLTTDEEYDKLQADQDRYLNGLREKISASQERLHKIWNAAEAHYQREMKADTAGQLKKAEFRHYSH